MSETLVILSILGALLVGAVIPGPSFVLVSRIAAKSSRTDGLAAALGMGAGGLIFATLALMGLVAVLLQVEQLYIALRVLGGLYLVYLGVRIWRSAPEPLEMPEPGSLAPASVPRSFALGLVTQLSNPKTAIVYASIFATLLPASAPLWLVAVLPPLVFALEFSWYAVVALVFSAARPRAAYLRSKLWVDRIAGAVLGVLGARLVSGTLLTKH